MGDNKGQRVDFTKPDSIAAGDEFIMEDKSSHQKFYVTVRKFEHWVLAVNRKTNCHMNYSFMVPDVEEKFNIYHG
jgi:hypothetical protein